MFERPNHAIPSVAEEVEHETGDANDPPRSTPGVCRGVSDLSRRRADLSPRSGRAEPGAMGSDRAIAPREVAPRGLIQVWESRVSRNSAGHSKSSAAPIRLTIQSRSPVSEKAGEANSTPNGPAGSSQLHADRLHHRRGTGARWWKGGEE